MKSLLTLHISCLRSVSQICSTDIARDERKLTARWKDEGDSFLTITLPRFAKVLERALDAGQWPDHEPLGFKRSGGLPAFMRGFLIRIFHKDGSLLDDPDTDCIWAVRQVCYLSHKIERDCTSERTSAAFAQFVKCEEDLLMLPGRIDRSAMELFKRISKQVFGDLFAHCDNKIAAFDLVPKHGPGAVAEKLSQVSKREYNYWTERLQSVFPFWRYTRNCGYSAGPALLSMDQELPVRVITVPKTQATPRIIAIEPSSVQYAQQGLKREIYEYVGRDPLLRQIVGFSDQTRNRKMAEASSSDRLMGTLDLSEASDRVHWFLIHSMTEDFPHLRDFLMATRSMRADVPGYGVLPLQKYASMGSALTFPLETIVFTTLALMGMFGRPLKRAEIRALPGSLSVYGDDIIVPIDAVDAVIDRLEHFGARVNRSKSFWTGLFRESCGAEFYRGTDVSVVRLRSDLPRSRRDAAELAALVDFRNRSYRAGMWSMVKDIDEVLDGLISLPFTSVSPEDLLSSTFFGGLSKDSFLGSRYLRIRWNADLQYYEHQVPYLRPRGTEYFVDGEAGLLEWFHTSLRESDLVDRYTSQERASSFNIKRRWTEAF